MKVLHCNPCFARAWVSRVFGIEKTIIIFYIGFCLIVFMSDHQTFCNLFKVRQHVIGCIKHDIIVGLGSKLLRRLSYYTHLGYGKHFSSHMGNKPRSFCLWSVYSTTRPEHYFKIFIQSCRSNLPLLGVITQQFYFAMNGCLA